MLSVQGKYWLDFPYLAAFVCEGLLISNFDGPNKKSLLVSDLLNFNNWKLAVDVVLGVGERSVL